MAHGPMNWPNESWVYIRPRDGADARIFDFTKMAKNCQNDPR